MSISFSIIIPTYNRAGRIVGCINSIIEQDYSNFEIIVIDDGSTDNTKSVISAIEDKRIRYFFKKNEERAIARNYGIEQAKGDYVTFLDSDDKLLTHYFSEALRVIQSKRNPEWLHLAYEIVDEKGKVIRRENNRKGDINLKLIEGNHLSCIGVFVRRDIIKKHRFNKDPDVIGSEDYLLWLELAGMYPLYYSNRVAAFMVQHSGRSVINFNSEKLITRIDKLMEYLFSNDVFMNTFQNQKNKFEAFLDMYLALHLLPDRKLGFKYLVKSIRRYPPLLIDRRIFGFFKNFLSV